MSYSNAASRARPDGGATLNKKVSRKAVGIGARPRLRPEPAAALTQTRQSGIIYDIHIRVYTGVSILAILVYLSTGPRTLKVTLKYLQSF